MKTRQYIKDEINNDQPNNNDIKNE